MKPYTSYKYAQTPWLTEIPTDWSLDRIGMHFFERKTKVSDKDYPPLSVTKKGILPQLSTVAKTNDTDNRKMVMMDDFVINSRSDRRGSSGMSPSDGSVSLINIVLTPYDVVPKWCHYLFRSHAFIEEYYRNGRGIVADLWTTRYSEMRSIFIPVPSRKEQDQIVRFLDWKVSEVNHFICQKRREIKLLSELKKTIIVKKVTDVKDGWKECTLRELLFRASQRNRTDLPLLSVVREKGVILREYDKSDNHNVIPEDLSNYQLVQTGQFVMNKMKAWQGSYGVSNYDGIVSPAYFVFDLRFENKDFFHYAIRSRFYVDKFEAVSSGIRVGQWDLPIQAMKGIKFLVPPPSEQSNIVTYLTEQCAAIDKLILKIKREITFITEYRVRMISDVVTGKVDVRDIEVPDLSAEDTIAEDADDMENDDEGNTDENEEVEEDADD